MVHLEIRISTIGIKLTKLSPTELFMICIGYKMGSKTNTTSAPGLLSSLLTWEKVESYNVGLDFGFLNNRLTGSFDYFVRNTKNMVGKAPELPSYTWYWCSCD